MAFVPDPNDSPRQRMVDKLVSAGWIESAVWKPKPEPSDPHAGNFLIKWTDQGRARLIMFLMLIQEVENKSTRIADDEWPWFRTWAEGAAITGGPPRQPPNIRS